MQSSPRDVSHRESFSPPNISSTFNANVNVDVNVNVNVDDTACHEFTLPPEQSGHASIVPRALASSSTRYVKLQNPKKTIIFENSLRRCDNGLAERVLAGQHGVPQTSQGVRKTRSALLNDLRLHTSCNDFCLITQTEAEAHGIHNADSFTAKELRAGKTSLQPSAIKRKQTAGTSATQIKKARLSNRNTTYSRATEWPRILPFPDKAAILSRVHTVLERTALRRTACATCGTSCPVTGPDCVAFDRAHLDVTTLETAVQHQREVFSQPLIPSHMACPDDGRLYICSGCRPSIRNGRFVSVPPFSYANACWIGPVPEELQDLSYVESIAIARARGTKCFIKLEKGPYGQSAALGNVCILPQEPRGLSSILPPPMSELANEVVVVFVSAADVTVREDTLLKSPLLVRRDKILRALSWLKAHNPEYAETDIQPSHLLTYPELGHLPAPTQHMLPSTSLSSESSSYTTYSGEANLEVFEENPGAVPVLTQTVLDLDDVSTTYQARKLAAISRLKQGARFLKYPSGDTPLVSYQNPRTWTHLWPTLFPYGIGAFEDPVRLDAAFGLRKLHTKTQIARMLHLSDQRFCVHPAFIFVMANVLQRRASSFSATLATKRLWFDEVQRQLAVLDTDVVTTLQDKLAKDPLYVPTEPPERACINLLTKLRYLSEPVIGSTGEISAYREEIRAATRLLGLPHLYVTINPADFHHPIAQILAGRDVPLRLPEGEQIAAAERQLRAKTVACNPVAGARFFDVMMNAFFEDIVGTGSCEGVFGEAAAHYGIVEAQDRGSLHCHMFIWLKGGLSPMEIKQKAGEDPSWASRYLLWLEDIVKLDLPSTLQSTEDSNLPFPSPTMGIGPSPSAPNFEQHSPLYLTRLLECTGQVHTHGNTCFKHLPKSIRALRDETKDCRFQLPRPTVPVSSFEEDGSIRLKCSNGMVNGYNDVTVSALACNMDCKAIGSGTAAMAMIYYVTNYISKLGLDNGLVMSALAASMKAMEQQNQANESIPGGGGNLPVESSVARLMLLKTVNQMIGKRKLSGQQVSAYLCGLPNRYTSLQFCKVYWGTLLRAVLPEFYCVHSEKSGPVMMGETDDNVENGAISFDCNEAEGNGEEHLIAVREEAQRPRTDSYSSAIAEDYAWRPVELEKLSFLGFLCEFKSVPVRASRGQEDKDLLDDSDDDTATLTNGGVRGKTFNFRSGHTRAMTRRLVKRSAAVIPVLLGPNLPRRDRESELDKYHATMLLLFKPWPMTGNVVLRTFPQSWSEAFHTLLGDLSDSEKKIMDHMQQLHECKDAKDDHSAQRRLRESLLRGKAFYTGGDEGDDDIEDSNEAWQAAMQDDSALSINDANELFSVDGSSLRAADYAEAAGFYDVILDSDQANTDTAVLGTTDDVEAADTAMQRLLEEKATVVARRCPHLNQQVLSRDTRSSDTHTGSAMPHLSSIRDELEAAQAKYISTKFNGIPWRRLHQYQKLCIMLQNKYSLNERQTLAFLLICDATGMRLLGKNVKPLRLLIGGPGGTGKSQVFQAVQEFFGCMQVHHQLKLTAPTGVAASNIGGSTIHSEASLRVSRMNMRLEKNRTALEGRWQAVSVCVVDEVSFLGANDMALLNEYLKLAKGGHTETFFGGLDMVFVGDMAQLPPPMSRPLYDASLVRATDVNAANDTERRALSGITAYRAMNRAVVLNTVMRQTDPHFIALLGRLRFGMCTLDDKGWLDTFVLTPGGSHSNLDVRRWMTSDGGSPLISYRNGVRDLHNVKMARAFASVSGQKFVQYHSVDKIGKGSRQIQLRNRAALAAWAVPPKKAGDLHGKLPLLVGMPVFCTENIATELGISNGSVGTVAHVIYREADHVRYVIAVHVDFPAYRNLDPSSEFPHRVTLTPVKSAFQYTLPDTTLIYSAVRWQVPLIPAFAYTVHNSQGRSLSLATVDLASAAEAKDKSALAYVMLSRLRSPEGLTILRPFPFSVISTHISQQVRTELKRIEVLGDVTRQESVDDLKWYYSRT